MADALDEFLSGLEESTKESAGASSEEVTKGLGFDVSNDTRNFGEVYELSEVVSVYNSSKLKEVTESVEFYSSQSRSRSSVIGTIETDPEYILLVKANQVLVEIQNELELLRRFIRDHYGKHKPGLDTMVPTALEYARTVKILGNNPDITSVDLSEVLPPAQRMGVAIAATSSNTSGPPLKELELELVKQACDTLIDLDSIHTKILRYVESRIRFIAPNTARLVGTTIAAQLIAMAGGLLPLSRLPANIIQILGPKPGYISECEIVKNVTQEFHMKAVRLVAGKVALASRADSQKTGALNSGKTPHEVGEVLRAEVESTIEHWMEPPPLKQEKPLKIPGQKVKKHRGGKRMRRYKEMYSQTEVQKALNRVAFGGVEETDPITNKGFGMLASKDAIGKLVYGAQDRKIMKRSKQKAAQFFRGTGNVSLQTLSQMTPQSQQPTAGSATSLRLSSGEGIALALPQSSKGMLGGTESVYFKSTTGFQSIVPKSTPNNTVNYFQ